MFDIKVTFMLMAYKLQNLSSTAHWISMFRCDNVSQT